MKTILTSICLPLCLLGMATLSFAQLPLADLPVRVGGYVYDDQGQPINGATVTFIDQTDQAEYQGTTDPTGWYGNVGFSAVPETPSVMILGQSYPNPTTGFLTVEIASQELEKSLGFAPKEIKLYDLRGRKVGSVPASSGTHDVQTKNSAPLAEGVYLYKLGDEVQRLVGSPKRVTVKTSSSSGGEKALVQYRRVTEASGFEIEDVLVELDEESINFASMNLVPTVSTFTKDVAFQVRNIAGDQRQAIGEVVLRNAIGTEFIALSDVDSVYRATVEVASESEILTIFPRGITDYESMTYVILDPDSVAVRGMVADATPFNYPQFPDTARVAFNHYALDKELFLEIVSEYWMGDGQFRQSVGVIFKRYYDRNVEIWTNTADSDFTIPAPQYAIDRLVQAENNLVDMFENTLDEIPLINSTVVILPSESGAWENLAVRYIDNNSTPLNGVFDLAGDGFMDYHYAHIRQSDLIGYASVEIANEFAHDLSGGNVGDLFEPTPPYPYNARGRAVAATWAKFSNGRNFNPSVKGGGTK